MTGYYCYFLHHHHHDDLNKIHATALIIIGYYEYDQDGVTFHFCGC